MREKLEDLTKKNPWPSCCQNLKAFQDKIKSLDARATKAEKMKDEIWYECGALRSKNQGLWEENQELRLQLRDLSWKPSQMQIDIEKMRNPRLGEALDYFYSHHHPIADLGLLQKRSNHPN